MFWDLLREHFGKTLGMAGGLLFGFIYLWVGILDTFVIIIFVITGFYFGRKHDNREDLSEILDRILPGKYTKP